MTLLYGAGPGYPRKHGRSPLVVQVSGREQQGVQFKGELMLFHRGMRNATALTDPST
jgi:hypothetical protein